ncbi:MAG: GDP-L-fucose synthase [Pelagibacteraceae bacterium]|nr:GDP-L-fucose synthase [Pelagibacteraceae bacterium]
MNKNSRIYVAGHNGLVGSAIVRRLKFNNYKNILTVDRKYLDLSDQKKVYHFLRKNKPKAIIIAAARVGGIVANNKYRADFINENLIIQSNLIHGAFLNKIKNLIFLGSSCVYPKNCKQPIKEDYLLNGSLEYTNEPYAIAKIAGIKMCENYNLQYKTNYKSLMPTNTYGPDDNYNIETSHFFPAIIKKVYEAKIKNKKTITLWGTGKAKRELIYVDDLADACIFFMLKKTKETLINIGSGKDFTIRQYANFIMRSLNLNIKIKFDKSKPDGTPRKLLDISLSKKYGWFPKISLKEGFFRTYKSFVSSINRE